MYKKLIISIIMVLILAGNGIAAEITRDGLVAEWHFDRDAKDSSGNGIDGTIYGATFVDGKVGKALSFNGINDYVDFGTGNGKLDFGTGPFSIEFWMNYKGTTVHPNVTDILGKTVANADTPGFVAWTSTWGGDGSNYCLGMITSTGPWGWEYDKTTYVGTERCNNPNTWYHIDFVRSGNTYSIYKNGDFSNSWTGSGVGLDVNNDVSFKIGESTTEPNFNGIIDEVRIYNRALSVNEIRNNFLAESQPPMLSLSSDSFNFGNLTVGESRNQKFSISNSGGGTLTWSISSDDPWITINPANGINSGDINININSAGLNPGIYNDIIIVTSNGGNKKGKLSFYVSTTPTPTTTTPTPTTTTPTITSTVPGEEWWDKDMFKFLVGSVVTIIAAIITSRYFKDKGK